MKSIFSIMIFFLSISLSDANAADVSTDSGAFYYSSYVMQLGRNTMAGENARAYNWVDIRVQASSTSGANRTLITKCGSQTSNDITGRFFIEFDDYHILDTLATAFRNNWPFSFTVAIFPTSQYLGDLISPQSKCKITGVWTNESYRY